jgi:hypothetical protein
MQVIRLTILLLFIAMLAGRCIYPFDPGTGDPQGRLVIHGSVTDREGNHYIEISRSTSLGSREKGVPLSDAVVIIRDHMGNEFPAEEIEPGRYASWITSEYLTAGTGFQLYVLMPDGREYISDFDALKPSPPIDSISWEIRDRPGIDLSIYDEGIQFFVHTDASGDYAMHYKWELVETWEYHSVYPIYAYYDGTIHLNERGADSLYYCWITREVPEIFTYSTMNLTTGMINGFPLNFVPNQTSKLSEKYSLLVRQFALSPKAFEYWSILGGQARESGELYSTQPAELRGNIRPLMDQDESVIGLFYASSVTEKRIFIEPLINTPPPPCEPYGLDQRELMRMLSLIDPEDYPVYLMYIPNLDSLVLDYANPECFDCRLHGGDTEKPDFWE